MDTIKNEIRDRLGVLSRSHGEPHDVASNERIDMAIHDLRNSLGSIILNLELAASPEYSSGIALESAADALVEARKMNRELPRLRSTFEERQ